MSSRSHRNCVCAREIDFLLFTCKRTCSIWYAFTAMIVFSTSSSFLPSFACVSSLFFFFFYSIPPPKIFLFPLNFATMPTIKVRIVPLGFVRIRTSSHSNERHCISAFNNLRGNPTTYADAWEMLMRACVLTSVSKFPSNKSFARQ